MSPNPSQQSSWSDLPGFILGLILNCLCFNDSVHFAAVCKSWRRAASNSLRFKSLGLPWVVVPRPSFTSTSWFFYSPMEARTYYRNYFTPSWWIYLDTPTAWLMVYDKFSTNVILLLNPLTEKTIWLPPYRYWPLKFTTAVMSSDPLVTNCVLVALDECFKLVSCMLRPDAEWFIFNHWWTDKEPIVDIIFFNGLLYAVTLNHKVLVFEFFQTHLPMCRSVYTSIGRAQDDTDNSETIYLVESDGRLLMVIKRSNNVVDEDEGQDQDRDDTHSTVYLISIYELDLSVPRWTKVTDLGDEMLIIGSRCCRSIRAENFSQSGFRRNCVYFTDVDRLSQSGELLQFCIGDQSTKIFIPFGFPPIRSPFHWIVFKG